MSKESAKDHFKRLLDMRIEVEGKFTASQNLNEIMLHSADLQRLNDRITQFYLDSIDRYSKRIHWLTVALVIFSAILGIETLALILRGVS